MSKSALRAVRRNTPNKPASAPSEITPSTANAATRPPASAAGNARKTDPRQPPASEGGLEQQVNANQRGDCKAKQLLLLGLLRCIVTEDFSVVFQRELDTLQRSRDVAADGTRIPPNHICADIEVAKDALMGDAY